jgi:hypothetical protein
MAHLLVLCHVNMEGFSILVTFFLLSGKIDHEKLRFMCIGPSEFENNRLQLVFSENYHKTVLHRFLKINFCVGCHVIWYLSGPFSDFFFAFFHFEGQPCPSKCMAIKGNLTGCASRWAPSIGPLFEPIRPLLPEKRSIDRYYVILIWPILSIFKNFYFAFWINREKSESDKNKIKVEP